MSDTSTKLRDRLDRLQERSDVTVKALADRAGYSRQHTHAVLNGSETHDRAVTLVTMALEAFERESPTTPPNE